MFKESTVAIQPESDMFFLHVQASDPTDEGQLQTAGWMLLPKEKTTALVLRGESMYGRTIIKTAVCGKD